MVPGAKTLALLYGLVSAIAGGFISSAVTSTFLEQLAVACTTGGLSALGIIIAAKIAARSAEQQRQLTELNAEKLRHHGKALDALMAGQFMEQHPDLAKKSGFPLEVELPNEND